MFIKRFLVKMFLTITALSAFPAFSQNSDFKVLSVSPQETLPAQVEYPSIQIVFSKAVVPLKALGKEEKKSSVFSIEPELDGVFRWKGSSILSFDSKSKALPQKKYTIKINKNLSAIDGSVISGQLEYTFETEELKLVKIIPGWEKNKKANISNYSIVPKAAKKIALVFNSPVKAGHVSKSIIVKDSNGGTYSFKASQLEDVMILLELDQMPPEDTDINIVLQKGAESDVDCLPVKKNQTLTFHTIQKFKVISMDNTSSWIKNKYDKPVRINFSNDLKTGQEASLAACLQTEPPVNITGENITVWGRTMIVHGLPFDYKEQYKLVIKKEVADVYDRHLEEDKVFDIKVPDASSFVFFKNSGLRIMEGSSEPKIEFTFQNIKSPSSYTIEPLTNAVGAASLKKSVSVKLNPKEIPQNKRIKKIVDLSPFVDCIDGNYRGAVLFNADIAYDYSWRPWHKKELEHRTSFVKNTQVIQFTDLGVDVHFSNSEAFVMVSSLTSGEPVKDAIVNVKIVPEADEKTGRGENENYQDKSRIVRKKYKNFASGKTDSQGLAFIEFEDDLSLFTRDSNLYIEVKTSDDRIIFRPSEDYFESYNRSRLNEQKMVSYIFTDSDLYKPGEKLSLKVIDRNLYKGVYSIPQGKESEFTLELLGAGGKSFYKKTGRLSSQGTAWAQIKLPEDIKPGTYDLKYTRSCNGRKEFSYHYIKIQFFEKIRFSVTSEIPEGMYYSGDELSADVSASYLGGGGLDGVDCTWRWSRKPVSFKAKKADFEDMTFGPVSGGYSEYYSSRENGSLNSQGKTSLTSSSGGESVAGKPYTYSVECKVVDSGNQAVSSSAYTTVHSSKFYIGLSSAKGTYGFASPGKKLNFEYVCISPEEKLAIASILPIDKKMQLEVFRENTNRVQHIEESTGSVFYTYEREEVCLEKRELKLDEKNVKGNFSYTPEKAGAYLIRLTSKDCDGRKVITEKTFYVSGKDWVWFNEDDSQEIKLIPSKDEYQTGEKIQILAQTELPAGKYLVTLERESIISHKVIQIDSPTFVVDLEGLGQEAIPIVYVSISSYSNRKDSGEMAKAYYGTTAVNISRADRTFKIELSPDKSVYGPGDNVEVKIKTLTNDGKPLPYAEVALMAVDRGLLDLTGYRVKDPSEIFYNRHLFANYCSHGDSRSLLVQAAEEEFTDALFEKGENEIMLMESSAASPRLYKSKGLVAMNDSSIEEKESSSMQVRKDFSSFAAFIPVIESGKDGTAVCSFKLPDNLTTYRVTAVGVKGCLFASEEKEIQATNPISVRQVLPRIFRLDDKGQVGLTVSNLDTRIKKVEVKLDFVYDSQEENGLKKLPGLFSLEDSDTKEISVKGQSTVNVNFSILAKKAGWTTLRFTVKEKGGDFAEQVLLPMQIEKPYIFEAVTVTGQSGSKEKENEVEKIILPGDAEDGRGSLFVQLDPTRLGALCEAVNYVFHYPYGCMEQRSAAVLPLIAFGNYIDVFGLDSEVKDAGAVAAKEIAYWACVQNKDGGFPYWPDGYYRESNYYVSLRIAEIYALARERKIVKENTLKYKDLLSYIQKESRKIVKENPDSSWSSYAASYAAYVSSLYGEEIDGLDISSLSASENCSLTSSAFFALAYLNLGKRNEAELIAKKLLNYTRLTSRGIDISIKNNSYYWCFFNSKSEPYALFLQLFTSLNKDDEINGHLVYELLKMQTAGKGYWQSTAVTSRVLMAIDKYIRDNDLENLDFTGQALLGGKTLLQDRFSGVNAESVQNDFDFNCEQLKDLPREKELDLEFKKEGRGKLFYTASMKYAIPAEKQSARDEGLCVFTEIFDAESGERISGNSLKYGKTYVQKVTLSSVIDCEYLALRVPVPAGCEIVNTAFVTSGTMDSESPVNTSGWNRGLSYKGIYDAEVQYFWNRFNAGCQEVTFTFRAKSRGRFQTPCVTAQCMYEEEIFGRSDGRVWTVKD